MLRALRFIGGATVGIAIWWYATPAYDGLLSAALHLVGVAAEPVGRTVTVTRIGTLPIHVPADQLTYNFILFAGLLAAMPPRVWRGIVAFLALCVAHAIALYTTIEATYALQAGAYSEAHYSPLAQDFWKSAEFITASAACSRSRSCAGMRLRGLALENRNRKRRENLRDAHRPAGKLQKLAGENVAKHSARLDRQSRIAPNLADRRLPRFRDPRRQSRHGDEHVFSALECANGGRVRPQRAIVATLKQFRASRAQFERTPRHEHLDTSIEEAALHRRKVQ